MCQGKILSECRDSSALPSGNGRQLRCCARPAGRKQQSTGLLHLDHSNLSTKEKSRKSEYSFCFFGPSVEIRTRGLLNPIQARYQTSPHPDIQLFAERLDILAHLGEKCKHYFQFFENFYSVILALITLPMFHSIATFFSASAFCSSPSYSTKTVWLPQSAHSTCTFQPPSWISMPLPRQQGHSSSSMIFSISVSSSKNIFLFVVQLQSTATDEICSAIGRIFCNCGRKLHGI